MRTHSPVTPRIQHWLPVMRMKGESQRKFACACRWCLLSSEWRSPRTPHLVRLGIHGDPGEARVGKEAGIPASAGGAEDREWLRGSHSPSHWVSLPPSDRREREASSDLRLLKWKRLPRWLKRGCPLGPGKCSRRLERTCRGWTRQRVRSNCSSGWTTRSGCLCSWKTPRSQR
jgi:hypothetical protein